MHRERKRARWARPMLLAMAVLPLVASGCGSSDGSSASPAADAATSTTIATSTTGPVGGPSTTTKPGATTSVLPDASEAQRTAPPDGTGTALLSKVRVGRNDGYERIVFEFEGASVPGYRIQWVDGPITADGSGEPVDVAGDAFLEMIFEPASGVDMSSDALRVTYDGPDHVSTNGAALLTDLVRTGDFEAVLTWVAGATERAPFRVLTLSSPTRVVVDVAT